MLKIDHVHFYVEDSKAWRDWFVNYLGFQPVAVETDPTLMMMSPSPDTCTEVVHSGVVYFFLSSPVSPSSPVAEFLHQHPPGVADVAFVVANLENVITKAESQGVTILQPIQEYHCFKWAKIAAWGGLTHTLIERPKFDFQYLTTNKATNGSFTTIDHVVLNVEFGSLQSAVAWYQNIFDFQPQQTFKIQTEHSGLYSQVLVSRSGHVKLPINEPTSSNSQIQEFLELNGGAGIQHIALLTPNLVQTIAQLRLLGLSFLRAPQNYYLQLEHRLGFPLSPAELQAIAKLDILVDWQKDDPLGALILQIFTEPIFGQPTFFFEFIERRFQASGFGEGNFRALFAAMENEQIKRGFVSG